MPRTATGRWLDVGDWTLKNPDGKTENFTYDILKLRYGEREHSSLDYIRGKLRCSHDSIDHAAPHRDLVAHQLILPSAASDLFMSPDMLWNTVDRQTDWDGEPHLLAGPTIWFPSIRHQHWAIRQAAAFAQAELADAHGVAVHLIAHEPARIAHGADFHVHLLCTARVITNAGLGTFAKDLVFDGCQTRLKAAWDIWWAQNPER
jgi:hypothetical protein